MNDNQTLTETFASNLNNYPIWYYKKIKEVGLEYVIPNLLKETFVINLDGENMVLSFNKNENGEICCLKPHCEELECIYSGVIANAFKEGIWFKILEEDTSPEFKELYEREKNKLEKSKVRDRNESILKASLVRAKEIHKFAIGDINEHKHELNKLSDEELDMLVKSLLSEDIF